MQPVEIYSLGQFEILVHGMPARIEGRGPRKPLELLSLLLVAGTRGTNIGAVADNLWPDSDGFDAYRSLITTVYRLRRLLECPAAIHMAAGTIRLDPLLCQVDVWRFEHALRVAGDREQLNAALDLYAGPFLPGSENPWVIGMRTRLQHTLLRAIRSIGTPARMELERGYLLFEAAAPDVMSAFGAGTR